MLSIAGAAANENTSITDNINESIIASSTDPEVSMKEEERDPPGFEAVFPIVGLLAVAYLVRQKED